MISMSDISFIQGLFFILHERFIIRYQIKLTFMNEISYKNQASMSDKALIEQIGTFVKYHRLRQNKTQDEIAKEAGISRSTLSLLERGKTVTVLTLIQVLRMLDQLHIMDVFRVDEKVSPMALAKLEKEKRKRASRQDRHD
jgi:DNA-binding XRE family transcriptional regulator